MDSFEIHDGRGASLTFFDASFESGDFQNYRVRLANDTVKAEIQISGRSGGELNFFSDLSSNWRGWSGAKVFESLEHDFQMAATSDSTGHIDIEVRLKKYWPTETTVTAHLLLESGQLAIMSSQSRKFFSQSV
jgi:hypothetical protein